MFGIQTPRHSDIAPVAHAARQGTQAVERALALLHEIATDSGRGRRLCELSSRTGLDRATARRLVSALIRCGFVEQDGWTRRYYLGMQFFSVAAAASNRLDLDAAAHEVLERLSAQTGWGATFMRCQGLDLIVADSCPGAANHHGPAYAQGARAAVGANAYGIAILSRLTALQAEDAVIGSIDRLPGPPEQTVRMIRASLVAARRAGHAVMRDLDTGIISLAVPVRDAAGAPVAALGIDGIAKIGGNTGPVGAALSVLVREARTMEETLRRLS